MLADICGSPITMNLSNYLGVPLIHGRITKNTYKEILLKTQKRLASWKSASLSFAGRCTLVKSVASALPIYAMQSIKLPTEVCSDLDKLNRDFIWGNNTDIKKVHLVKWDIVCAPKKRGGLGFAKSTLSNVQINEKVRDYLLYDDWDVQKLVSVLPQQIVSRILSIHAGSIHNGIDKTIWDSAQDGEFTVKKAYEGHFKDDDMPYWKWSFIWNLKLPPRVLHFLWILHYDKMLTNNHRATRGLTVDITCDRCKEGREDSEHVFRGCTKSLDNWEDICKGVTKTGLFATEWNEWFYQNLKSKELFLAGEAIRDHNKNWLGGFSLNKGVGSVIEAELWGIFEGLKLAWEARYRKLVVESDYIAVYLLTKKTLLNHPLFSIIQACKALIVDEWSCHILHIHRECNKVADGLTDLGHSLKIGITIF
ncbi:hypothetical protein Ddye_000519 [Dipteronia dyeriana]|uniref:Reverse transcriptase n=1 Tax=Dipteronia dyeriana TaxID=168575 RepID=A0AAE0CSF9_9ROSI|nr:hypothetical protein Ddye_000519 [Dipteronia dyeriana]